MSVRNTSVNDADLDTLAKDTGCVKPVDPGGRVDVILDGGGIVGEELTRRGLLKRDDLVPPHARDVWQRREALDVETICDLHTGSLEDGAVE